MFLTMCPVRVAVRVAFYDGTNDWVEYWGVPAFRSYLSAGAMLLATTKLAANYIAFVPLASIRLWLRALRSQARTACPER